MSKLYRVGIYCRLSVDDAKNSAKAKNYIPADESTSIENQREILSKFVMLNGWTEEKVYIDDGYSGGSFQRPGFQEMLADAQKGRINLILVKDLSRLGRDYVEVGRYTDVVFPSLGCRFISVLDCLDTDDDNTDMLHFRSLMNDYHLKELSNKIKSVRNAKMKSGQFLSAYAPYGYRKSSDDKHRLVIDEDSAAVVRRIFTLRREGMAYGKIAAALNNDSILCPRAYWYRYYGHGEYKGSALWTYATVKNILHNVMYIGTLKQSYSGSRSYKDKTRIRKPESEWISHEDDHEAIVATEEWEVVQEINRLAKLRSEGSQEPSPALFTGKLICADCKKPLCATTESQHRKNGDIKRYVSYICSRYSSSGRSVCSWHRIYEITLKQLVTAEIRIHAEAVDMDEAAVVENLKRRMKQYDEQRIADARLKIGKLRRRLHELEGMTAKLYEDKVGGTISGSAFTVLMQKNEQERLAKTERLDALLSEVNQYEQDDAAVQNWAALIQKHLHLQELDREVINELIDHIEIGERTVIDGQRCQEINVFYNFVGMIG